jgi:predicted amidohydrolase
MQDLVVSLVQADQKWEDKNANLSNYERLLEGSFGSQLILLPEMFNTGFTMNTALAESIDTGGSIRWLREKSSELNAAIYTSLIVEEEGAFYNASLFVHPSGDVNMYKKRKTFSLAGEDKCFASGNEEVIVEYMGWKFQLQICYDLRFPEIVRNKISADGRLKYDAILYVANWPEKRSVHWKALLKARAIENQCYVIGVNRVGVDGNGHHYSGDSVCIEPMGGEVFCSPHEETVLQIPIRHTVVTDTQMLTPFLKDQ